jgi:hypothetical protein
MGAGPADARPPPVSPPCSGAVPHGRPEGATDPTQGGRDRQSAAGRMFSGFNARAKDPTGGRRQPPGLAWACPWPLRGPAAGPAAGSLLERQAATTAGAQRPACEQQQQQQQQQQPPPPPPPLPPPPAGKEVKDAQQLLVRTDPSGHQHIQGYTANTLRPADQTDVGSRGWAPSGAARLRLPALPNCPRCCSAVAAPLGLLTRTAVASGLSVLLVLRAVRPRRPPPAYPAHCSRPLPAAAPSSRTAGAQPPGRRGAAGGEGAPAGRRAGRPGHQPRGRARQQQGAGQHGPPRRAADRGAHGGARAAPAGGRAAGGGGWVAALGGPTCVSSSATWSSGAPGGGARATQLSWSC